MKIQDVETVSAAAALCGVARGTLQHAIDTGRLATHALAGGTVVVAIADVRRYLATRPGHGGRPRKRSKSARTKK